MILRNLKANSTNIASYTVDDLSKQTELWSNIVLCCYLQLHFFTSCCFLENKILNKLRTVFVNLLELQRALQKQSQELYFLEASNDLESIAKLITGEKV